jgi:hypothetical protein
MTDALQVDERARELSVFISYARTDMGFADKLLAALEIRDFKVPIDRRDLPYGEELKPEIIDFIRGSDAVVFVVSPRSVRSAWCKWEVEQVKSESKRLVPIVLTPVPVDLLPTEISDINLLQFDDGADFEHHVDVLAEVLGRDQSRLNEQHPLGYGGKTLVVDKDKNGRPVRGPAPERG